MDIRDSVSVVTGGASGLGEACVRDLVNGGGKAAIFDFAEERGAKIASELEDAKQHNIFDASDSYNNVVATSGGVTNPNTSTAFTTSEDVSCDVIYANKIYGAVWL